ncbi:MAG: hypothetical protein J5506_04965 [Prevotella sp.]|nr:hypothetical protein [Prevotella sp.]
MLGEKQEANVSRLAVLFFLLPFALFIFSSCSTQKNTAKSRWWHSFNARYNTYYNGAQAYIDGSLEKEKGNKDNYTEMIPLYTVGNKNSKELGKGNFERAIEKSEKAIKRHSIKRRPEWNSNKKKTERDIEWLNRREYNPFLWKAWMLLGRSQFMKGDFEEAASTFAYMSRLYATQPAIYGKARAWLAKCYIEQDWMYDAEDVITKMRRDSLDWRAVKEWDYTYADYYIHLKRFEEAIPYLRKVIKHEMRRKQKAREWFLMGQIEAALGHREQAYKAFKHVVGLNPPYELEFNARIAMTEVMAAGRAKQMIGRLKRMAASDNNKDYLDQVYYAIGNIYLTQRDTTNAIAAYEKGNQKATRSGIEKGVLLLHLGDLYWAKEKFGDAQRCYGEAIGLLDKDRDDYEELSRRSKILDELAPHTESIHLQDSLQELAKMSEKDRNAAIDRVIDALKKKEREERRAAAEAAAQEQLQKQGGQNSRLPTQTTLPGMQQQSDGQWYFYNPIAVSQGKTTFQRLWGKRENVDNWQRANKTVVASFGDMTGEMTEEMRDSLERAKAIEDSLANVTDSAQNDPHKREYYLAQIPFTPEQVEASNKIIEVGLYNAGVIFKDKLDNLRLSEEHLRRLTDNYPDFEQMADAYYHLYLLYARKNNMAMANVYLDKLKAAYPDNQWTMLLSDPYYKENSLFGEHIEDSLYAATYEAFKADRYTEVAGNTNVSKSRFPMGANRDKFIFIGGLSKLNSGDASGCLADMKEVVEKYPQSRISELAGMIINGVQAGRRLHGGKFDMGNVWERRSIVLNDSDSIAARELIADRDIPFVFMVAYEPDSLDEHKLLFELAKFNFTSFLVRNFDITTDDDDGLHRMSVAGFRSYDEALQYARQLYSNPKLLELTAKSRSIIISEKNLELLGNQFSYDDYDEFYEKNFAPLKISTYRLLTEPAEIEYRREQESENGNKTDDGFENAGGFFDFENAPPPSTETVIPLEEETTAPGKPVIPEETVIPVEEETDSKQKEKEKEKTDVEPEKPANKTEKKVEEPAKPAVEPAKPVEDDVIPLEEPVKPVEQPAKPVEDDVIPWEEPVKPVVEPAKPVEEPVKPVEPPAKPATPVVPQTGNTTTTPPASEPVKPTVTQQVDDGDYFIFDDDEPAPKQQTQAPPATPSKTTPDNKQATDAKQKQGSQGKAPQKPEQEKQNAKQTTTNKPANKQPVKPEPKKEEKKQQPKQQDPFDVEDEYYDLEGF